MSYFGLGKLRPVVVDVNEVDGDFDDAEELDGLDGDVQLDATVVLPRTHGLAIDPVTRTDHTGRVLDDEVRRRFAEEPEVELLERGRRVLLLKVRVLDDVPDERARLQLLYERVA